MEPSLCGDVSECIKSKLMDTYSLQKGGYCFPVKYSCCWHFFRSSAFLHMFPAKQGKTL